MNADVSQVLLSLVVGVVWGWVAFLLIRGPK